MVKSDQFLWTGNFCFRRVVLLRPHYLSKALIDFICIPWHAIWGHIIRKKSQRIEVLSKITTSIRSLFCDWNCLKLIYRSESIWIQIYVSIDSTVFKYHIRITVALFNHWPFKTCLEHLKDQGHNWKKIEVQSLNSSMRLERNFLTFNCIWFSYTKPILKYITVNWQWI